jgi:hypothetical protein
MKQVPQILGKPHGITLFAAALVVLLCACGSSPKRSTPIRQTPIAMPAPVPAPAPAPAQPQRDLSKPVRTVPAIRPEWVGRDPSNNEERFFIGKSPQNYAAEQEAENAAREDARIKVMSFYGELLQSRAFEKSIPGFADLVNQESEIRDYSRAALVGTNNRYTEVYRDGNNRESYVVYLLYSLPRREVEENVQRFTDKLSRSYVDRLSPPENLRDALVMCDGILAGLRQNPLHQALAYIEDAGGRTGLFQFLSSGINRLVNGLSFNAVPALNVQKTDILETSLSISSKEIESIGAVNTQIRVYGADEQNALESYQVPSGSGNSFPLKFLTQNLMPGRYTVRSELLLKELISQQDQISRNIIGEFFFEVTPVNVIVQFGGEQLIDEEKNLFEKCLGEALQAAPVQIVREVPDVQNRYSIIITVNTGILPPLPALNTVENAFWDISLTFLKNGAALQQTETRRMSLSRTNSGKILSEAANYILDNRSFAEDINTAVSR